MMQKRRWLPKSPARAEAVDPTTRRLISSMEKKHKREMEKVKKSEYNAWRRVQRAREEVKEPQVWIQEATEVAEEQYEEQFEAWRREKEGLKKDLSRLNACNCPSTVPLHPRSWDDRAPPLLDILSIPVFAPPLAQFGWGEHFYRSALLLIANRCPSPREMGLSWNPRFF